MEWISVFAYLMIVGLLVYAVIIVSDLRVENKVLENENRLLKSLLPQPPEGE